MRALAALFVVTAACTGPTNSEVPLVEADFDSYAADVQPIVRSCGSLDCHGVDGRPLRLYAKYGLRMSADLRGEAESDAELAANVAAFSAIDPARVLGKPLHEDAGGMHHIGGDLWADEASAEYRCVAGWLADSPDLAACADALDATPY